MDNLLAVNVGQTTSHIFRKANFTFASEGFFIKAEDIGYQIAIRQLNNEDCNYSPVLGCFAVDTY